MMEQGKLVDITKKLQIGNVFTPLKWAMFAIEKFNLFSKWINGASIFDPTMGTGNLLEALINYGLAKGYSIENLPTQQLFGNELNTTYYIEALNKFKNKYGLDMFENFTNEDFLKLTPHSYDIIFGNPPWQNFVDLPESYKGEIKSYFFKYDLIDNAQNLLLGGSRIDFSALIIKRAIKDFLKPDGEAVIFLPLSLFLNEGANKKFRNYQIEEIRFSVDVIYDFNDDNVFEGISTRYGLVHFLRDKAQRFPIMYLRYENASWKEYKAEPLLEETDPLSVFSEDDDKLKNIQPILLNKESMPRQGINTCGANDVYIFSCYERLNENFVIVSNKNNLNIILPEKFIFPLITSKEFKDKTNLPSKWILLPYDINGKPLEWSQIQSYPELCAYLEKHKEKLKTRKGKMLGAVLNRGYWWAMLGVGRYNFFPYKVVWEAYGRKKFNPQIFEGRWQANQALQAYIPVRTLTEAQRIQKELSNPKIENYLLSLKMEGNMNWAQPGKIKKFIRYI